MKKKPKIAISACLLGENCRYDGRNKYASNIVDFLADFVEFVPLCPEAGAGLSTPRPPMALFFSEDAGIRLLTLDDGIDRTRELTAWIERSLPELADVDAFILKARSPSCGFHTTPVAGLTEAGSGLFAKALASSFPNKPIASEEQLNTRENCLNFVALFTEADKISSES